MGVNRSEEHTSELQSLTNLVCRLLLEKKNATRTDQTVRPRDLQRLPREWHPVRRNDGPGRVRHRRAHGAGAHPRIPVLFFLIMRAPPEFLAFPPQELLRP